MNRLKRKQDDRPKAFWGALISAGVGIANALINSSAQEKQRRLQASLENYNNNLKEAQGMTNALNAGQDYQQNYLQQFKQQARLGTTRRLGGRNIMITDGGNAKRIGNNTYLLRGGSHEDINETGQTGIGINVGGNEIEAEGGEVAQRKGNSLRIYSAQPILGGMSPAQAIMRGYNKDKVFNAQQRFKKNNGIKDDGGKAQWGMGAGTNRALQKSTKNGTRSIRSMWNSAKGPLSYTPIVGTTIDGYDLINNPSKTNAANFGVSLISDLLGYKWLKQVFNTPVRRTVNFAHRGRVPSKVAAATYSGAAKGLDTEMNYFQNKKRYGGLTSKDRGSSKHPYPSVSSKDFAGGNRSYPIPTKADAIDALRLAGLHGRSDVRSKVYNKYPELRKKADFGTLVPGGIPGTDSYRGRMYSGYDISPFNLLNILNYLDRAAGFVDENGNSRYITGIAPTPGRGKMSNKALLRQARRANNKVMMNPVRENSSTIPVSPVKPGYTWNGTRITTRSPYAGRGMQRLDMKGFEPYNNSVKENPISLRTIHQQYSPYDDANIISQARNKRTVSTMSPMDRKRAEVRVRQAQRQMGMNGYYTKEQAENEAATFGRFNTKAVPAIGLALAGISGAGIAKYLHEADWNNSNKPTSTQKDAKGQPISPYIARPQEPVKPQTKAVKATRQVPASVARKDTTRTDTTKQVNKVVKRQVRTTPQYTGNTTRGNYQLHDGETKVINGVKYTRRGNTIINHKTNIGYIYDKNGNYTGQADYSKVGNFNQAFDAARAAGRSQFIYRAGKYNNYSTVKETNAKKEALNRRIGARRIAKRMGGLTNPPVGSRKKYLPGGTANPWDKYRFTDYPTPNTWNERYGITNIPNYGGTAPWQISNKYAVNAPYSISEYDLPITTITAKKDTFNDEMSKRMRAGDQNLKDNSDSKTIVPYLGKQSSFKPTTQDYIGLGIDTLASLGIGLINSSAAGKTYLSERPAIIQASKLPTYYNVAPEVEEIKRQRDILNGEIANNTSSSVAALNRISRIRGTAAGEINKLYATKENEENKMLTQDALNQQQVAAENAKLQADYETNKANILNAASQAKANALSGTLSGLSQAWTNFASSVENRYNTRQNEAVIAATAKDPAVLSNAIQFGYNFSPEVLAGVYNSTKDENLKDLVLSQLNSKNRRKYGIK